MKKVVITFLVVLLIFISFTGCSEKQTVQQMLTIYTYDSFISYGLPDTTNKIFENEYNCKINYVSFGDSEQSLNRLILEKGSSQADIFVGVNIDDLSKALNNDLFISYKPKSIDNIPSEYLLDKSYRLIPFDGPDSIAIIYDSDKIKNPPKSFQDLLKSEYAKKLILEDPRTSGPGMSFLLWTIAVYGQDGFIDYWKKLNSTIFQIYPGWDAAFTAFTKGEAPMMLSYDTDPAYFYNQDKTTRYKAVIPEEGGWMYLEFAGIVKGTKHEKLAQEYINFMLSENFQKEIPSNQWMFPIVKGTPLPVYYNYAVKADKYLTIPYQTIADNYESWLKMWIEKFISE
jgi:thiamine transport system substrate-binding protein